MNSFPPPAIAAAAAALVALPFSVAAAGTLFFTAALGSIIHADYVQRCRRVRLPKVAATQLRRAPTSFARECHQLAA